MARRRGSVRYHEQEPSVADGSLVRRPAQSCRVHVDVSGIAQHVVVGMLNVIVVVMYCQLTFVVLVVVFVVVVVVG